ncbi:flavorubredoxin [Phenylobacterium haematophilum]|uniref:Flavorubredoxin n=1 Tax=Phenylobacterium haematophilum TaxID=98513 RepID=A0A840A457_9CAUL|nr:MBL fold metallo-hydrolase [Phenylobacterium haematophilum]MBB3893158.1 flavorubredoxin [Phenylobacterium haematophilum]
MSDTKTFEIADGIYRFSTAVSGIGSEPFTFNQFLILADAPMLFHLGHRAMHPSIAAAVERVTPLASIRYLGFGHVEADECGALNAWLAAAPHAEVVHGQTACMVSLNDLADRPPRPLADRETIDLGGKRMRWMDTPHVPHGWEAGLFYEETGSTLFCGDLLTHGGDGPALTESDVAGPAIAMEEVFHAMSMAPNTGAVLHQLAGLEPTTLALMHGSSFRGDGAAALRALAAHCAGQ